MTTIYKYSVRKTVPSFVLCFGLGIAAVLYGDFVLIGGFFLFFITAAFIVLIRRTFRITNQGITHGIFGKSKEVLWQDVVRVDLVANPDFPWSFGFLYILPSDRKKQVCVPCNFLEDSQKFLKGILERVPPSCEVNQAAVGFAASGKKYKWKVFLETDWRSIKQVLLVVFILLMTGWLIFIASK